MLWIDYNIESFPDGSFTIKGDWPGEVMGLDANGAPRETTPLYQPGDVFIVDQNGLLRKADKLSNMIFNHEGKNDRRSNTSN